MRRGTSTEKSYRLERRQRTSRPLHKGILASCWFSAKSKTGGRQRASVGKRMPRPGAFRMSGIFLWPWVLASECRAVWIMGVLLLAAEQGSELRVRCEGEDAEEAANEIVALVARGFGEG